MKTSDPEVEFLLTAETEWREQNIDSRQQDKGNYNNRHAVFPRGHVNDLEVRQDIWCPTRLDLGTDPQQDKVDDKCRGFEIQEVERQFKQLAKAAHPDTGGNAEQFCILQEAREQALQYFDGSGGNG